MRLALVLLLSIVSIVNASPLMKNWGLYNREGNTHIDAPKAWKLAPSGKTIRVCVIDTGVDVTHSELKDRICAHPGTDEYGWDFVAGKKNPTDTHGHGTHVAGIIRSVSPTACVIPVKWFADGQTPENLKNNTVEAIYYCINHKANVINYSGGGGINPAEELAIRDANYNNIMVVAAAGNEYVNLDSNPIFYPASYKAPNLLAVAAIDINGHLLVNSDWGIGHVQLAAPGGNILSTIPDNKYGYLSGTSMAAPFVTGVVAILLSQYPKLTVAELKEIVTSSVDKEKELKDKVSSGGKVNAYKALLRAKELVLKKKKHTV